MFSCSFKNFRYLKLAFGRQDNVSSLFVTIDCTCTFWNTLGCKEVSNLFIVNLEEFQRYFNSTSCAFEPFDCLFGIKQLLNRPGHHTVVSLLTQHGEGLSTPCLAISKYCDIVSINSTLYKGIGSVPNVLLAMRGIEDIIKTKCPLLLSLI